MGIVAGKGFEFRNQDRNPQHYRLRGGAEVNRRCDYLIVGAGSAGCVVASWLAAAGFQVHLIEANDPGPPKRRPAEYLATFGSRDDWGFRTVPQSGLANRQLHQPRGRGPGGSTRINAMIWYPPRECDLPRLHLAGGDAWHPDHLRSSLQAVTGWTRPQSPVWCSEASRRFLDVAEPPLDKPHLFSRMADRNGRVTSADCLDRNLPTTGGANESSIPRVFAHADQVVFDNGRAVGVYVRAAGRSVAEFLAADRGVILCGGSFASPAVLMRSGIGPADILDRLAIPVRCVLPEVGQNLVDHLIMPVIFGVHPRGRFPTRFSPADLARWQVVSTGPVAGNLAESGAIGRLAASTDGEDTGGGVAGANVSSGEFQIHVTPTHYLLHPADHAPAAMTIGVNLCSPGSRGNVTIESTDSFSPPRIDPAYLSDPNDIDATVRAVAIARQIASGPSFYGFVRDELLPGAGRDSTEGMIRAIRRFSQTLYHPVGTCRMAADGKSGVVDASCRVRGTEALYVIDGSILPAIPSVNPNATIMTMAHHFATRLIEQ
jgi:choline dehydrogenase